MSDPSRYMGLKHQGENEQVSYGFDTALDGGSPSGVTYTVLREESTGLYTDVTSTCMTGSATITGDVVQLPL